MSSAQDDNSWPYPRTFHLYSFPSCAQCALLSAVLCTVSEERSWCAPACIQHSSRNREQLEFSWWLTWICSGRLWALALPWQVGTEERVPHSKWAALLETYITMGTGGAVLGLWSSYYLVDKRTWVFTVCRVQVLPRMPATGSLPGLPVNCILHSHPLQQRRDVSLVTAEQTSLQRSAKDTRNTLQGKCGMYIKGLLWFLLLETGEWSGFLQQTLAQTLISNSNMCFQFFQLCEKDSKASSIAHSRAES